MKTKLSLLALLASALVLSSVGCKSISTRSTTHFYAESGQEIAKRVEHTHSTGFFVKGESVAIKGTLTFTNSIGATSTAPAISLGESKQFNADKISSQADSDAIKATGGAIGEAAGAILK